MKDSPDNKKKTPETSGQSIIVDGKSTKIDLSQPTHEIDRSIDVMKVKPVKLHVVLKKLMKDKGVSSRVLSKNCSIPLSTVGSYLADKKAAYNPEHLNALSEYFNTSVDYLLFGIEKQNPNLNLLKTEDVFQGWLKVKVERLIPDKPKISDDESGE